MKRCEITGCKKFRIYESTKTPYCEMHKARIKRHGYPELKRDAYQSLEKLPHAFVDSFIRKNCKKLKDEEIVKMLRKRGYRDVTVWNVKYRRRKLGIKKYLYGEVKKHKEWIRRQAIKKYGDACELCNYNLSIETHHIIPKYKGGSHEVSNLTILCPNCHSLITKRKLQLNNRKEIPKLRKVLKTKLKLIYP